MRRRNVLLGTTAVLTGFPGCSVLSSSSPMLDLVLFSHADSPYTIEIGFFSSDGDTSRSEARVYSASINVEQQGRARRTRVAEARPYVVRYSVYRNNRKLTDEDHVHYYPTDDGDDELVFDIDSAGILTRRGF